MDSKYRQATGQEPASHASPAASNSLELCTMVRTLGAAGEDTRTGQPGRAKPRKGGPPTRRAFWVAVKVSCGQLRLVPYVVC
jgi:hypothetical protein